MSAIVQRPGNVAQTFRVGNGTPVSYAPQVILPPTPGLGGGDPSLRQLTLAVEAPIMTSAFAPLPVLFRARVIGGPAGTLLTPADRTEYDPTWDAYQWIWDMGEEPLGRNQWVGYPWHRQRNIRHGSEVGHVFFVPATRQVRVYCFAPNGLWGVSDPITVVANDPNTSISPERTIVLSNNPNVNWGLAPPHDPANRCTSFDQAVKRKASLVGSTQPWRISAEPGTAYTEVWAASSTEEKRMFAGGQNAAARWLMDTWDRSGAPAVLSPSGAMGGGGLPGTFQNWRFIGDYLREFEMAKSGQGVLRDTLISRGNQEPLGDLHYHCFDKCEFWDQKAIGESSGGTSWGRTASFLFNDCDTRNLGDYFLFGGQNFVMLNSAMYVEEGMCLGAMSREIMSYPPFSPLNGNWLYRYYGQGHNGGRDCSRLSYFDGNYIVVKGGWSGQTNQVRTPFYWNQGFWRATNSASGNPSQRLVMTRNMISGSVTASPNGQQAIIDYNVIVTDPMMGGLNHQFGQGYPPGFAFRCNEFIHVGNARGAPTEQPVSDAQFRRPPWENAAENFAPSGPARFESFISYNYVSGSAPGPEMLVRTSYRVHNSFSIRQNALGEPVTATPVVGEVGGPVTVGANVTYAPDHGVTPAGGVTLQPWAFPYPDAWYALSWNRFRYVLPAPVGPNESTPLIPYPTAWDGTSDSLARYAGSLNIGAVFVNAARYNDGATPHGRANLCDIALGAGGITVTNRSTDTWSGVMHIQIDYGTTRPAHAVTYVIPENRRQHARLTDPAEYTGSTVLFDITGQLRPGPYAISPQTGVNTVGPHLGPVT